MREPWAAALDGVPAGTYRVQVCHGDLDTVVYWTETDIPIATAPSPHIAQGGP